MEIGGAFWGPAPQLVGGAVAPTYSEGLVLALPILLRVSVDTEPWAHLGGGSVLVAGVGYRR